MTAALPDPRPTVVLVAHEVHHRGGTETATAELVQRAAGSVRFVVVACRVAPELRPLVEWRRVVVPARPLPLRFVLFWLIGGFVVARARRGALVHTVGALVPNRADVATVHYCHAAAPPDARTDEMDAMHRLNSSLQQHLAIACERWSYRPARTARLLAVSDAVASELHAQFPRVAVDVALNGVDHERFHPDAEDRAAVRRELAIADDRVAVLFVGGDWGRKGLGTVLRAVAQLADEPVVLLVVGAGDPTRYRALVDALGHAVRFVGRRDDPERLYHAADVYVSASRYESFSMAAFEAAASGVPLVVTPVGDVASLIDDGRGGRVVPDDPTSVAAALRELTRDPARRATAGASARQRAAAYTWDRNVRATLETYRQLEGSSA